MTDKMNMNNIYIKHYGYTISIAQHREGIESSLSFDRIVTQEIMVLGTDTIDSLIKALQSLVDVNKYDDDL